MLASKESQSHQAALERCIAELQDELVREHRRSMENFSQKGSNSRQQVSPSSEEHDVDINHDTEFPEEDVDHPNEYDEYILMPRTVSTHPPVQQTPRSNVIPSTISALPTIQRTFRASPITSIIPTAPVGHQPPRSSVNANTITAARLVQEPLQYSPTIPVTPPVQHPLQSSPTIPVAPLRNGDSQGPPHDDLIDKEVILYAIRGDQPVAKGVIISINPRTMLAGQALGKQYCEVVITVVLKRDAILPRPYVGVEQMVDAKDLSIAWPYCRVKVSKASKSFGASKSSQGTCGR